MMADCGDAESDAGVSAAASGGIFGAEMTSRSLAGAVATISPTGEGPFLGVGALSVDRTGAARGTGAISAGESKAAVLDRVADPSRSEVLFGGAGWGAGGAGVT